MVEVNGLPFLAHLLSQLVDGGITRVVLMTGYRGEQIFDFFGPGDDWGCEITYSPGPAEWLTGRRLIEAQTILDSTFLLLYADNFALVDVEALYSCHSRSGRSVTLTLAQKIPGNVTLGGHEVRDYNPLRPSPDLDHVEIGYMVVERDRVMKVLGKTKSAPDVEFSAALESLVREDEVGGVPVDGYHSISDPGRLELAREYLSPKKLLLVDRDGVINQRARPGEYISNWDGFHFIDDAITALELLAQRGFRFIVISNQAGISRGMVDPEDLKDMHDQMVSTMARRGIEVDGVYVSPHHWDEASPMRKPEPGMFLQASKEHLFRLDRVLYVGDDLRDCQATANAGCGVVFLGELESGEVMPSTRFTQQSFTTFTEAVPFIIDHYARDLP